MAGQNGQDKAKVDRAIDSCLDMQIVQDLSNNDKHGYPLRNGGRSGKSPQLIEINRDGPANPGKSRLLMIGMTIGPAAY